MKWSLVGWVIFLIVMLGPLLMCGQVLHGLLHLNVPGGGLMDGVVAIFSLNLALTRMSLRLGVLLYALMSLYSLKTLCSSWLASKSGITALSRLVVVVSGWYVVTNGILVCGFGGVSGLDSS